MKLRLLLFGAASLCGVACSLDWGRLDPREVGAGEGGASATSTTASTSGGGDAAGGGGVGGQRCTPGMVTLVRRPTDLQMVLMLDRSGSMGMDGWTEAVAAISTYVQSAEAADVDFALNYFPGTAGADCNLTTYETPAIPLVRLGNGANDVIDDLMAQMPVGPTPLDVALEGTLNYVDALRQAAPEASTYLVVVGDGPTSNCGGDDMTVDTLAAMAAAQGHRLHFIAVGSPTPAGIAAYTSHAAQAGTPLVDLSMSTPQLDAALTTVQRGETPCRYDLPPEVGPPAAWTAVRLSSSELNDTLDESADCSDPGYQLTASGMELCPEVCTKLNAAAASLVIETSCEDR